MAALAGREILRVEGTGEHGFTVTYRDTMGAICKALVPPLDGHPDYQIASRFQQGRPVDGARPLKSRESDFWG